MLNIKSMAAVILLSLGVTVLSSCGSLVYNTYTEDEQLNAFMKSEKEIIEAEQAVQTMLEKLASYEPGTAGSSLKIYISAFGVLNFAEEYSDVVEEFLSKNVEGFVSELSDEQKALFKDTVTEVESIAKGVFEKGISELAPVLEDAGNPQRYDSYSRDKFERVITVIKKVID